MSRRDPRPHYGVGRRVHVTGYVDIWAPKHPLARKDGYVYEHRMLAWDAGLFDDPELQIHHVNGDKQDNRLENLQALTASEHTSLHQAGKPEGIGARYRRIRAELGDRECEVCGSDITPLRIDAKVCGDACRVTRFKRRRREAVAA